MSGSAAIPIRMSEMDIDEPTAIVAPVRYLVDRTGSRMELDTEWLTGLVKPFSGRAQQALMALVNGYSRRMAALSAGFDEQTLRRMCARDREFALAVERAESAGFGRVFEAELYDRALDREDRGSMRALELVVKARSADYREKAQLALTVVHAAQDSSAAAGSWKQVESGSG